MEGFPYDHWQKCKTFSGIEADLVISALQKEIRRNHVENAALLAYEMMKTSKELEDYMWYRLGTISVEDVGMADPSAPVLIGMLDHMRHNSHMGNDRMLLAIQAVRYLCQARKDRSNDEMLNWMIKGYEKGELRPEIPSYAVDMHTLKGQMEGKDENDFYAEGAKVSPEWEGRDRTYRERIARILEPDGGAASGSKAE